MSQTGSVAMSGTASMQTDAGVVHVPPTLEDQIISVAGQDPILMGATGYMDNVFTTRLVGDTE